MKIYVVIACDGLEDTQETALKEHRSGIVNALNDYVEANTTFGAELINDCESEFCENWQLGIAQTVKKANQLKFPINLFNDLAKQYKIDCEIGSINKGTREPVSYFGHLEGKGDPFMIAQYLELN